MSNQLLRSGTCIGARIIVAEHSQSKKELVDRLSIAQKEINETIYWLELLRNTGNITAEQFETMHDSALEMVEIIAVIFTNTKLNNELNIIAHNPTSNN